MNCKIIEDKKANVFKVFEIKTEQVLNQYKFYNEAKEKLRFYNLGGAFDGFTPNFIVRKVASWLNSFTESMYYEYS